MDLTTSYAGPTAAMYLGDLGAEVIKVERPGTGDDARHWGPPFVDGQSAWFASANRNKKSICLNLSSDEGRLVLDRLIAHADVLLESMNPAKLARLGLEPDDVLEEHPHLVYCAVSGYGLTGPDRELPGYDLMAQARSGIMSVTGPSPECPQRVSTALSDIAAAMVATSAISAALVRQQRTGRGALVDVGLLDVDLALMAPRIASYLAGEPEPQPSGATDSVLSVYQTFHAADRAFVIAVGNDGMWRRMCSELGLDEFLEDDSLATNAGRREHRERIVARLEELFATAPADEWRSRLEGVGVPTSLIQSLSEVVEDPQVVARQAIMPVAVSHGHELYAVVSPWRMDTNQPASAQTPPPQLGADLEDILGLVGYSTDEVRQLVEKEAAWRPH